MERGNIYKVFSTNRKCDKYMMPTSDPKQRWCKTITEQPKETHTAKTKHSRVAEMKLKVMGDYGRPRGRSRNDMEVHGRTREATGGHERHMRGHRRPRKATRGHGKPPGGHGRPPGAHRGKFSAPRFGPEQGN